MAKFDRKTKLNDTTEQAANEAMLAREPVCWDQGEVSASNLATLGRLHSDATVIAIPLPDLENAFTSAVVIEWAEKTELATLQQWASVWMLTQPLVALRKKADRNVLEVGRDHLSGFLRNVFGERHYWSKGIAAFFGILIPLLMVIPADSTLRAEAVIEDSGRRAVAAPAEGFLAEVLVVPGDPVTKGQVVARLDDQALKLRRLELVAQRTRFGTERAIAARERDSGTASVSRAQTEETQARLAQVERELEQTQIRADIDGVVLEGDLRQRIGNRIEFGEQLMFIAPKTEVEVQLQISNRDAERIQSGLRGALRLNVDPSRLINVEVVRVKPSAETIDGELKFIAYARMSNPPARLEDGMQGVARLDTGRRSLWDVWVTPVWEAIYLFLWRWLP
jgi:biotin carboxyl carrier protein